MREDKYKQLVCIAETEPQIFQDKVNGALATKKNPEIILDRTRPFTVYILYTVTKESPETPLEAIEYFTQQKLTCGECPYLDKSPDKRKVRHTCRIRGYKTRLDSPACEECYRAKRKEWKALQQLIETIPYSEE